MYLWCSRCQHAHPRINWEVPQTKYGVCPTCGSSEYNNALDWILVADANGYSDIPDRNKEYPLHPVLFNFE